MNTVAMLIRSDGTIEVRRNGRWETQRQYVAPALARARIRGGVVGGRWKRRMTPMWDLSCDYSAGLKQRWAPALHDFFDFGKSPVYRAVRAYF